MFHNMNMTSPVDESNTLVSLVDRLLEQQKSHLSTSSMTTVLDDNKKIIQRRPRRRQTFLWSQRQTPVPDPYAPYPSWFSKQPHYVADMALKGHDQQILIKNIGLPKSSFTYVISSKSPCSSAKKISIHTIPSSECMTFLFFWRL